MARDRGYHGDRLKNLHGRLKVTASHHARVLYICEIYFLNNVTVRL